MTEFQETRAARIQGLSGVPQYIHLEAVRTSLQVIAKVRLFQDDNWLQWSRPAALSTNNPKRNLQGGWKTRACREAEAALKETRA